MIFQIPIVCLLAFIPFQASQDAPPNATMLRYPDISQSRIVFSYANGLWTVDKNGGTAQPVADPPGSEIFARFSPDGKSIAFLGNYEGNRDIYVTPIDGGIPKRVTYHPSGEIPADWMSDGRILFSATGMGTYPRAPQIFAVSADGGLPTEFPTPYGANPTLSANGKFLAYTPHSTDTRTWKRYRGGMATDIWVYDLTNNTAKRVTQWEGTDTIPMWHGDTLYYLCDAGPEHRLNIWSCDAQGGNRRQITKFAAFDIKWPSIGPDDASKGEIVFQNGANLMVLNLATRESRTVEVKIPGARTKLRPQTIDASTFIDGWDVSPSAKRAIVAARGDIWTLPAENGIPRNLTRSSAIAEREPTWSPDGKSIAFFDDSTENGYEIFIMAADGSGSKRRLTQTNGIYKSDLNWSPDSKKITYAGLTNSIFVVDVASGEEKLIEREEWDDSAPRLKWSHDSSWITYAKSDPSGRSTQIVIYDVESGEKYEVTSPAFASTLPIFDRAGEWLYYSSDQEFTPKYGSMDSTWIYDNSEVLLAIPLRSSVKAAWQTTESDEEVPAAQKKAKVAKGAKPEDAKPEDAKPEDAKPEDPQPEDPKPEDPKPEDPKPEDPKPADDDDDDAKPEDAKPDDAKPDPATTPPVVATDIKTDPSTATPEKPKRKGFAIEFENIESRAVRIPGVTRGAFGSLAVNDKGNLIYTRRGDNGGIKIIDAREKKPTEKAVTTGGGFAISADGKKILVPEGANARIVDASAGGTSKPVVTKPMRVEIDPRTEWRQMVGDAWLIFRDFFYDPNMHRVDWPAIRARYIALVDDANSREDVSFIISEMISELNVGHAYYNGGDVEGSPTTNIGLLGVDFDIGSAPAPDGTTASAYQIKRIYEGAPWESDSRNPLRSPGVNIKEGEFILAVNGTSIDLKKAPWAAFVGLGGKTVTLLVSAKPFRDDTARNVVVATIDSDADLRYRSWIEANRAYVNRKTEGRVGYVYVPNTGTNGQNDLMRQFVGQRGKDALIIDERWNGGGQIPTRFIELLNRPVTNWWASRDTRGRAWPEDAHFGPKAMLINGLAGSGGDMFPWLFRQEKLGPLVGTRTWGGLVGISGNPGLVDGGRVRVPKFAFYETDGTWGVEGHGVDPDVLVIDDPAVMHGGPSRGGIDPQIDVAVDLMEKAIREQPFKAVPIPPYPDRQGMGMPTADH
ncbi:MAG: PDZ domain-containing protein [Planctomycetota bacterium]|nr:PDZ domain-containing protein [Planctomycetota bacterium]